MPIDLATLAPLALGTLAWRDARDPSGVQRLTVIAKATFESGLHDTARLVDPYPLFGDVHFEDNADRSLRAASDFAPRKPRADVLVSGAVYAPVGERASHRSVRLALTAGGTPVIDKSVLAIGSRDRDRSGNPTPPVPFAYLPLRYELAYGGASYANNPVGVGADPGDPRLPGLVNPKDPKAVAGLGPVSASWGWRRPALGGADPALLTGDLPVLATAIDAAFFNVAPPDQRVPYLRGDEAVAMTGVHPAFAEVGWTLPGMVAHAALEVGGERRVVALVADTLWIEADTMRCTVSWRGSLAIAASQVEALDAARVTATLARRGEEPVWERRVQAFVSAAAVEPPALIGDDPPVSRFASGFLDRSVSIELDLERPPPTAPKSIRPLGPVKRVTPHVPVVNQTGLVAWTSPWQVRPPEHVLVVIVKATCTIGADGAVSLAEAQDPPSGDVPHEPEDGATRPAGAPEVAQSLRYSSDFALFKPATDVFLVGHAYPGNPSLGAALVELRVGDLRRRIAVLGDRAGPSAPGALGSRGKPVPFEKMPLRWERALGGPLSDANPLGRGYRTGLLLPNLERPDALIVSRDDRPAPACFAPIAPAWKARASKLGTYDASWQKARWPYFPADFDWSYFNAAPPEQQVPYLRGGEAFSIDGVRPGGGGVSGKLLDVAPRVFAQRTEEAGGDFFEVLLRLDTVWFDTDANKLVLIWRGLFATADEDAPDIAAVFVDRDTEAKPATLEAAQTRFFARVAASGAVPRAALSFGEDPIDVGQAPLPPPPPALSRADVLARLAASGSLADQDLTGVDLAGVDLTGVDLSRAVLARASLTGTMLDRARLAGAVLTDAAAEGASLRGADLTGADLTGARLARAELTDALLANTVLDGADLTGATLTGAKAERASLVGAVLTGAHLDRARLVGADLSKALLDRASLRGAVLDQARFYDARGADAVFDEASMDGVRADRAVFERARMKSVRAARSVWESAELQGATLHGAELGDAIFVRAKLDGAILSQAAAVGACFRRATMRRAQCLKTNLMHANFERADLTEADLRGANLYQVETWRAKLTHADLTLANVAGSKLARSG